MSNREKSRTVRLLELSILAGVAGAVVACGGKALDVVGGVVEDAGQVVGDAGRTFQDAGAGLLTDAGDWMVDAGRGIQDGSGNMARDAVAQDGACGTCTATGAQRTILASEDPERLLGDFVTGAAWTKTTEVYDREGDITTAFLYHRKLADGPLLVTDLLTTLREVSLYAVPMGTPCFERIAGSGAFFDPLRFVAPASARTLLPARGWNLTGSRLAVRGNESLCVSGGEGSADTVPSPAELVWAGFRPYE